MTELMSTLLLCTLQYRTNLVYIYVQTYTRTRLLLFYTITLEVSETNVTSLSPQPIIFNVSRSRDGSDVRGSENTGGSGETAISDHVT